MIVDKNYCMSSFLTFRTVADTEKCFKEGLFPKRFNANYSKTPIHNSEELEQALRLEVEKATKDGKAALALSGGIDSAILAKFMPKGSKAYTFKCVVPGIEVTNEVPQAAKYAEECGLEHEVVEIYWEDFEKFAPVLMKNKCAPFHSIEVQIYKVALKAKADGFDRFVFGESSDSNYGGLSGLMSKDWTFGEFVDRYAYVMPHKVLKNPQLIIEPYKKYEKNGYVDAHEFLREFFFEESMGSYTNACESADIVFSAPYATTTLAEPLDYERIRNGENKYLVREVFSRLYKGFEVPPKLPMPRATNEWFENWKGPTRPEFWPNCVSGLTGDQKWLVYILEKFLDYIDEN